MLNYKGEIHIMTAEPEAAKRTILSVIGHVYMATCHVCGEDEVQVDLLGGWYSSSPRDLLNAGHHTLDSLSDQFNVEVGEVQFVNTETFEQWRRVYNPSTGEWKLEKGTAIFGTNTMPAEELVRRDALCEECNSALCRWSKDGICMYPLFTGDTPDFNDDGCCAAE